MADHLAVFRQPKRCHCGRSLKYVPGQLCTPAVSQLCYSRQRRRLQPCYVLHAVATEELQGADLVSWKAVQSQIVGMGFSAEEADKFLTRAFAWKKGYWGPEKKEPEVPSTEQVQAVVDYLGELGIKDGDLHDAVKKFPEVLGMKVEERMKANVQKIESEFKLKGPALTKIFMRKPQVLGFNWDCYGDCAGNCPRCWVHF